MRRSTAWVLVQGAVTVVLLALLARTVDVAMLRALFARLSWQFYATSLAVVLVGQVAYAWRWQILLTSAGVRVSFPLVVRQHFIGVFVNNFLPSSVGGDVAKVYYLGREHGYRTVAASVATDRLLGVALLSVAASVALWLAPASSPGLVAAGFASTMIAVAAVALLFMTALGTGGLATRMALFGAGAVRQAERLQRLRLDMAAPLRQPAVLLQAAIVVAMYALVVTALYEWFVSLQHAPTPRFLLMFGAVTAVTVLSNIPVTLNGLGLREQLHVSLLVPLGIAPEFAVAISLLLYAHLLVASVVGLLFWLQQPAAAAGAPDQSSMYN